MNAPKSLRMGSDVRGLPVLAAGFEAPLEMLAACHDRIRDQCAILSRLRSHVAAQGIDDSARSAARGVIRYFDSAARHHHQDEEQDLFPALLESMAGSDPVCIRELTDSLTSEHRDLAHLWDIIRAWLVAIEAGETRPPEAGAIDSFVDLYKRHITHEEQELFPMAARLLGTCELEQVGRSMRLRREVTSF